MSAEVDAYNLLKADAGVIAIVGDRIYPDGVPEEVPLPSLAIRRLPNTEYITTIHDNVPRVAIIQIGVWCHASSRQATEALADAVEAAMFGGLFYPSAPGRSPVSTPENEMDGVYASIVIAESWQHWQ